MPWSVGRVVLLGREGAQIEAYFAPGPSTPETGTPEAKADHPRPGVLFVHDVSGLDAEAERLSRQLASEGFAVLAPDLLGLFALHGRSSREHAAVPGAGSASERSAQAERALSDRRTLADLEACLGWLARHGDVDRERLAVVGVGFGGTLAFQLACTSRRVAAAVVLGGSLVHRELSRERPIQPLELALNLGCPLLGVFGAEDPAVPRAQIELLERALAQGMKDFEIELVANAAERFLDRSSAGYHEPAARAAWQRCVEFLRAHLESH